MYKIVCLAVGYIIGCIQMAFIVGKIVGGIDIREHGSGNAGSTNVVRVLGPKTGIIVFIFDVIKGMVAFVICALLFDGSSAYFPGTAGILPGLYGGLGAVLGHNFPILLKGRGGKGSATTIGVIFFIDWRLAILCYLAGFISILITRYVSLGSMLISGLTAILLFVLGYPIESGCIGILLAGLSFYQHRGNIKRLLKGEENKFNFKKQKG